MVQVCDLRHSGLQLLKTQEGSVARVCEAVATHVTQPGQAQLWTKGRDSYLAYYYACASGGVPSLKLSAGV